MVELVKKTTELQNPSARHQRREKRTINHRTDSQAQQQTGESKKDRIAFARTKNEHSKGQGCFNKTPFLPSFVMKGLNGVFSTKPFYTSIGRKSHHP
jgi:hypothetical protein